MKHLQFLYKNWSRRRGSIE